MKNTGWFVVPLAAIAVAPASFAAGYLTQDEAQKAMFAAATRFEPVNLPADAERNKRLDAVARVESAVEPRLWMVMAGDKLLGYFAVHDVIGKQEYINYAVGLDAQGKVLSVEILTYRESHGYEIRNPRWRAQFTGKGAGSSLKLEDDIINISGATLSARHVTDGVRRIVALVDMLRKSG